MSSVRSIATAAVLILGSGAVGYGLRHPGAGPVVPGSPGARETVPPLEYFAHPRSFSELENAKAELDAAALRVLFELRQRRVETLRLQPVEGSAPDAELERIIELLEGSVADLQGTEWEPFVIRDLLSALKQAGNRQRWLNLYLHTLHRLPASEIPPVYAAEALAMARALGRDEEVNRALHWVLADPVAAKGHERIGRLFAPPESPPETAREPGSPRLRRARP